MVSFHINAKGEPGKCSATQGNCPFGEAEAHYATQAEARQAYEKSQPTFASSPAHHAMKSLSSAFQTFLQEYELNHKRIQGDAFEEFFANHLRQSNVPELSAEERNSAEVKNTLAGLKNLAIDEENFAPNLTGRSWFVQHPNGEYNFPDFAVATKDHVFAVEMKSGNNFTYIMLGAHTPRVTDIYVLADFQKKKELTMLQLGDHVVREKLHLYEELRTLSAEIKRQSQEIEGGVKVEAGLTFRSEAPHPFSHQDKAKRSEKVVQLFAEEQP